MVCRPAPGVANAIVSVPGFAFARRLVSLVLGMTSPSRGTVRGRSGARRTSSGHERMRGQRGTRRGGPRSARSPSSAQRTYEPAPVNATFGSALVSRVTVAG